jgi:hypothetical protein
MPVLTGLDGKADTCDEGCRMRPMGWSGRVGMQHSDGRTPDPITHLMRSPGPDMWDCRGHWMLPWQQSCGTGHAGEDKDQDCPLEVQVSMDLCEMPRASVDSALLTGNNRRLAVEYDCLLLELDAMLIDLKNFN